MPPLVTLDDADGGDALDPTRGSELPVCHPNAVVVAHHVAGNGDGGLHPAGAISETVDYTNSGYMSEGDACNRSVPS